MRFRVLSQGILGMMVFAAVCGVFLFTSGVQTADAAFGISPPFLNADHLVPGAAYEQVIYLVQDHPDVDIPIKATLTVPESIKSWITIDKGFDFVIPQGTRQFPVK